MSKEKLRTDPSSVRFDKEKLDFIMKKEKLTSKQQVIDLLVNKYWWEFKIPVPSHKESPPLTLKQNSDETDVKPMPVSSENFKEKIKIARSVAEIESLVAKASKDPELTAWQKDIIKKYGIEISRNLDF